MELGLAVPEYEKTLQVAQNDKTKYKSQGIEASGYLAGYYNNIKKDKNTAISYLQKGLEFDTANVAIKQSLQVLQKVQKPPDKVHHLKRQVRQKQ